MSWLISFVIEIRENNSILNNNQNNWKMTKQNIKNKQNLRIVRITDWFVSNIFVVYVNVAKKWTIDALMIIPLFSWTNHLFIVITIKWIDKSVE